jgi:hypothetical protein
MQILSHFLAGYFQQTGPSQQLLDGLVHLFEVRFPYGIASDEYQIPTFFDVLLAEPRRLPHEAFGPVTNYSFADPVTDGEAKAAVLQVIG